MVAEKTHSSSAVPSGEPEISRIGLAGICVSLVLVTLLNVPSAGGSGDIGVSAGDWIEYAYSYGTTPVAAYTEWIRVEFLSVDGTDVTMRGTLHLSNGTELNETFTEGVKGGRNNSSWEGPIFDTISGFLIPVNSSKPTNVTDPYGWVSISTVITCTDYDTSNISTAMEPCASIRYSSSTATSPIDGETKRTYLGATRTVVYTEFPRAYIENGPITCYWDKQTGALLETTLLGKNLTGDDGWAAEVAETSIWQTSNPDNPDGGALDPAILCALAIVAVAVVAAIALLVIRRRRGPAEDESPKS